MYIRIFTHYLFECIKILIGKKEKSVAPKTSKVPSLSSTLLDKPYRLNEDFIAAITEKQKYWFPTVYKEYEDLTIRELMTKAGGPKTFNSPPLR